MKKLYLILCLFASIPWCAPAQINPQNIEIVRDSLGIPHIYAPTDEEVAYGLAWASCEDKFPEVQEILAIAKERYGRMKGTEGVLYDFMLALIKADETVTRKYETEISDDFKQIMTAYTDGLNQYARLHPDEVLDEKLFPVTNLDLLKETIVVGAAMAHVTAMFEILFQTKKVKQKSRNSPGSNAILVHADRSEDGNNYLVGNPHWVMEGPISFYEVHLNSGEGWNCHGANFAATPVIGFGMNEHLAWTATLNGRDLFDLYELEMHPSKKNLYRFDGKWLELEKFDVPLKLKVMKGPILTVHKKAFTSVYGPTLKIKGRYFSIRMPAMYEVKGLEQMFYMNKARNYTEFRKALDIQGFPSTNTFYADRYDTIFYVYNGLFPFRNPGFDYLEIMDGDTSGNLWQYGDYHTIDELPNYLNPECGYLYNTNNSPYWATTPGSCLHPEDFDPTMGVQLNHNSRDVRCCSLVDTLPKVSLEALKRIKYDRTLPAMNIRGVDLSMFAKLDPEKYPDIADAIQKIKSWNLSSKADNRDAAVFLLSYYFIKEEFTRSEKIGHVNPVTDPDDYAKVVRRAKKHLLKHFGSIDIPLGELQRHRRGDVDLPLGGIPDVLAPTHSVFEKDGRLRGEYGDTFVFFVKLGGDGVQAEGSMPFGASNNPESPHFTDQMEDYVNQKLRPITLDKETIYEQAERIYHPQ